jgi:YidC/Oxa1 family membrane protein insertase
VEILTEALLGGLGSLLAGFYSVIPSYGLAIILLTIVVRLVLFPLTYKQTRSMQAMQRLQPKVKELQRKHKGNRQKLNEELMKLYKEHQVNPLGGCLPLLLQFPVFIALYAVLRGQIAHAAIPAEPVDAPALESAVCRPASEPAPDGTVSNQIECRRDGSVDVFSIEEWRTRDLQDPIVTPGAYMAFCLPRESGDGRPDYFECSSPGGISHLPRESSLRAAIIQGEEPFLGMQLGCAPSAAINEENFRLCAPPGTQPGGFAVIGYFGLIALMVLTTYYQQRQMQRTTVGPQAQQAQMMGRIMPIFLGFISYSIPAGVLLYWVTSNLWQIGQQTLMLRSRADEETSPARKSTDGKAQTTKQPASAKPVKGQPTGKTQSGAKKAGSRNARGRKKRSKR